MPNITVTAIIPASWYAIVQANLEVVAIRATNPIPQVRKMFTTALIPKASADSALPAAYVSSGQLDQAHFDYLTGQFGTQVQYTTGTYINGQGQTVAETPFQFIDRMGYRLKPGTI